MGADDAADLVGQGLLEVEVVAQIGLDRGDLPGADRVTGKRGEGRMDAAHLLDLLEQCHIRTGQAAGFAGHDDLALLNGDQGLDAQHTAGHSDGGGQTAALAQVFQVVDGGHEVQMLLGMLKDGYDLPGGLAGIPQMDGQTNQQSLAKADRSRVYKQDIVHIGEVCSKLGALVGAGQRVRQEDADDLVTGGSRLGEEPLEQLRAGLAGGGQLMAGCKVRIIFRGGQVDAVPQHGAVLEGDVQGDDGDVQCGGFGGQNVGCRIGENADHTKITSVGRALPANKTTILQKSREKYTRTPPEKSIS